MSIKSLLQLILLLMIVLIVGGIYFLYFYKEPISKITRLIQEEKVKAIDENSMEELLIEDNLNDKQANDKIESNDFDNKSDIKKKDPTKQDIKNNNLQNNQYENKENQEKNFEENIKNLTKEIEYITSNSNGDIYKISAKYGKTNLDDNNILDLEQVNGTISSPMRSQIFLKSKFAKYNYKNQNSKFYTDVELKYDNRLIICDNLELKIDKNIAIAYGNVVVKDENSQMKAQTISINIITKDISINSNDKIKIISN